MSNTVVLKRSAVSGKTPTTGDLALGELALNTYDGNLFFKKDSGTPTIMSVATLTGAQTLTNKTLASPVISGGTINNAVIGDTTPAAVTGTTLTSSVGDVVSANALVSNNSIGDEGGEIRLAKATTNTTLNTSVTIDIYQNKLRIFETGGTNRGAYIDISAAGAGVGSNLLTGGVGGSGTVTSITAGTGLSGGTITTTGTLALATAYGDTVNPYASKTSNYVLAAPNGSAGTPSFRALVAADIPTLNQNTTGSAATLTTSRNINGVAFNGSAAITITASTTNALTIGTGLSGSSFDGGSAVTIAIDSTVATLTGSQTLTNKTLTSPTINSATENNVTLTGTLTAGGGNGTNGQVLTSTGTGVQWTTVSGGSASAASPIFGVSLYDLGYVSDGSITISEDEGLVTGPNTYIYDLGILSFSGIISLSNLDQSVKGDYLGYSIIFGF